MAGLGTETIADRVELFGGMKLTRKFIAALVVGVAIVALIQGFFDFRREREVFDKQMRAEATALGRALARGMAEVWARDGEATAREFLLMASSKSEFIKARWVWLDARTDPPHASKEALVPMDARPGRHDQRSGLELAADVHPRRGAASTADRAERARGRRRAARRWHPRSRRTSPISTSTRPIHCARRSSARSRRSSSRERSRSCSGFVFIGRPVSRLAAKARRVGTGDLTGPLKLRQRDELGELATEINLMCDRLAEERSAREAATDQLRHADRLTTVGKLASGIAHELGTPTQRRLGTRAANSRRRSRWGRCGRFSAYRRRASGSNDRNDSPAARFCSPARATEVASESDQPIRARDRARRDDRQDRSGRNNSARARRHAAGRGR